MPQGWLGSPSVIDLVAGKDCPVKAGEDEVVNPRLRGESLGMTREGRAEFSKIRNDAEVFTKVFKVEILRACHPSDLHKSFQGLPKSSLQVGIILAQLLLADPRDGSFIIDFVQRTWTKKTDTPTGRDLLPMQFTPSVGAALKLIQSLTCLPTGIIVVDKNALNKMPRQQTQKMINEGTMQLWRWLVVMVLNGEYMDWSGGSWLEPSKPTIAQLAMLEMIGERVRSFCGNPLQCWELPIYPELMGSKTIDYNGEEVSHALPLRLEELLPGLPDAATAGSLEAMSVVDTREEWNRVVKVLYEQNILSTIPKEEIFSVGGVPILNGAFSVVKSGVPAPGQARITRLIMNMVPANSYQTLMQGDLQTLSSSSNWASLVLPKNHCLLWSSDDQRGAFYAWRLPSCWRKMMAFRWPVPSALLGLQGDPVSLESKRPCSCGSESATQRSQRATYALHGVDISEKKAQHRELRVVRMGAEIDGNKGTIEAPLFKKKEALGFMLWLVGQGMPRVKGTLMVGPHVRKPLTMPTIRALVKASVMLPMPYSDLRSQVSGVVTASDASEEGGGLCSSVSLTEEGQGMLKSLQSPQYKETRLMPFRAAGAMPVSDNQGPRIFVLSLFDGVGAIMCALARLLCQIVGYASSEIDKECKRLVRKRWPGIIELGKVECIDDKAISALISSTGYQIDCLLITAGSPCQDLTALLAKRAGLAGSRSKLFFEIPRVYRLCKRHFSGRVELMVENVFSMTSEARQQFSEELGMEPLLILASELSWVRLATSSTLAQSRWKQDRYQFQVVACVIAKGRTSSFRGEETKEQRKARRQGLSLRESLVTSQLLKRYQQALILVTQFLADSNIRVRYIDELDDAISSWVEHIFFEGESKSLASDGLASIQYHLPQAVGHLRMSWKLAKAWQKIEPPARVVPLSPFLTRAFAGACVLVDKIAEAACILTAFDALLRPGELYLLQVRDITFYTNQAVITLRDTKTGKRKGSGEMVVVESKLATRYLRLACQGRSPRENLLRDGAPAFRLLFRNLVHHFELTGLFAVYSLRRGGATYNFLQHGSMETTLLRGRWSSTSTARIYIQDTIATVSELRLTSLQRMHARLASKALDSI
eukprot:s197_g12.t1